MAPRLLQLMRSLASHRTVQRASSPKSQVWGVAGATELGAIAVVVSGGVSDSGAYASGPQPASVTPINATQDPLRIITHPPMRGIDRTHLWSCDRGSARARRT